MSINTIDLELLRRTVLADCPISVADMVIQIIQDAYNEVKRLQEALITLRDTSAAEAQQLRQDKAKLDNEDIRILREACGEKERQIEALRAQKLQWNVVTDDLNSLPIYWKNVLIVKQGKFQIMHAFRATDHDDRGKWSVEHSEGGVSFQKIDNGDRWYPIPEIRA